MSQYQHLHEHESYAAVSSADPERAERVARRIKAGQVYLEVKALLGAGSE
jgi:acyl-CoA reductase-like NAD-dependent aldehyde dehydrogenase